ncbi:unnamed protein product [Closterium sp. Naga37s-1]|nr:unnamed protein product [Closterium sp. Naga37s-1]
MKQFGTTYESIQLATGERVAAKAIENKEVRIMKQVRVTKKAYNEAGACNEAVAQSESERSKLGQFNIYRRAIGRCVFKGDEAAYSSGGRAEGGGDNEAAMKLPIAVEDVRREVAIMKLLSGHPNVVQFIDVFEDTDFVYICMEICEGGELLDRILSKRENRYSEKDAAGVVRQMLSVVAKCHLHGVVHRDLKPENFLFKSKAEDALLKATDFGLSDFRKPGKHFTDVVGSAYYVAPEVLKRRSGPESDVWSIGVITYILLSGRRPFWDRTEAGIFNEVLKKRPDFREKPWPNVSSSAKDFVKKLLKKDPRARPTAAQALSHKWVKEGGDASSVPLDIAVLSNMREFVKYSRLKQMALKALATTLEENEVQALRDQFNAMDINKDGTITIDEIRQALSHDLPFEVKESRVLQILQAMDTNCDGIIDFDEFVAATLHVQQLEEADSTKWQERSRAAFAQFDRDNDGYIDAEELRMAAQVNFPLDNLIAEADTDGDGRISLPDHAHAHSHDHSHSHGHHHHHHHCCPSPTTLNAAQRALLSLFSFLRLAPLADRMRESAPLASLSLALCLAAYAVPLLVPLVVQMQSQPLVVQMLQTGLVAAAFPLTAIPATMDALVDIAGGAVNIHVLMTVAALASAAMGNALEGTLLLAMFSISHIAEHYFTEKALGDLRSLQDNNPSTALLIDPSCLSSVGASTAAAASENGASGGSNSSISNGSSNGSSSSSSSSSGDGGSERREGGVVFPGLAALSWSEVPVADVPVGAMVLVKAGEVVPLDGTVRFGRSLVTAEHLTGTYLSLPSLLLCSFIFSPHPSGRPPRWHRPLRPFPSHHRAPHQVVPLDGTVRFGRSLVTTEHLTGEAHPVEKLPGNTLPGGSRTVDGFLVVETSRKWSESTVARIMQLTEQASSPGVRGSLYRALAVMVAASPCALAVAPLAYFCALTACAAKVSPVLFGWPFLSSPGVRGSLYRALAVMVAASPCALAVAPLAYFCALTACVGKVRLSRSPSSSRSRVELARGEGVTVPGTGRLAVMVAASPCALAVAPLAYFCALTACARKGILLKGGHALDATAACDTVAFDKTGTLTTGQLALRFIQPLHSHAPHTTPSLLTPSSPVPPSDSTPSSPSSSTSSPFSSSSSSASSSSSSPNFVESEKFWEDCAMEGTGGVRRHSHEWEETGVVVECSSASCEAEALAVAAALEQAATHPISRCVRLGVEWVSVGMLSRVKARQAWWWSAAVRAVRRRRWQWLLLSSKPPRTPLPAGAGARAYPAPLSDSLLFFPTLPHPHHQQGATRGCRQQASYSDRSERGSAAVPGRGLTSQPLPTPPSLLVPLLPSPLHRALQEDADSRRATLTGVSVDQLALQEYADTRRATLTGVSVDQLQLVPGRKLTHSPLFLLFFPRVLPDRALQEYADTRRATLTGVSVDQLQLVPGRKLTHSPLFLLFFPRVLPDRALQEYADTRRATLTGVSVDQLQLVPGRKLTHSPLFLLFFPRVLPDRALQEYADTRRATLTGVSVDQLQLVPGRKLTHSPLFLLFFPRVLPDRALREYAARRASLTGVNVDQLQLVPGRGLNPPSFRPLPFSPTSHLHRALQEYADSRRATLTGWGAVRCWLSERDVDQLQLVPGRGLTATISSMPGESDRWGPHEARIGSLDFIAEVAEDRWASRAAAGTVQGGDGFDRDKAARASGAAAADTPSVSQSNPPPPPTLPPSDLIRAALAVGQKVTLFHFEDQLRPGAKEVVRQLQQQGGLRVQMLTGDHAASAHRVAAAVGIEGGEVEAGLRPEDKLRAVEEMTGRMGREGRGGVLMVGDGINDAPALAAATVGVVLAERASATAVAAADVLLLKDNISELPFLVAKARQTTLIVKQSVALALTYILLALLPAIPSLPLFPFACAPPVPFLQPHPCPPPHQVKQSVALALTCILLALLPALLGHMPLWLTVCAVGTLNPAPLRRPGLTSPLLPSPCSGYTSGVAS